MRSCKDCQGERTLCNYAKDNKENPDSCYSEEFYKVINKKQTISERKMRGMLIVIKATLEAGFLDDKTARRLALNTARNGIHVHDIIREKTFKEENL